MMELEPRGFAAALTGVAQVGAAPSIALEDGASDRGGYVSPALARNFGRIGAG